MNSDAAYSLANDGDVDADASVVDLYAPRQRSSAVIARTVNTVAGDVVVDIPSKLVIYFSINRVSDSKFVRDLDEAVTWLKSMAATAPCFHALRWHHWLGGVRHVVAASHEENHACFIAFETAKSRHQWAHQRVVAAAEAKYAYELYLKWEEMRQKEAAGREYALHVHAEISRQAAAAEEDARHIAQKNFYCRCYIVTTTCLVIMVAMGACILIAIN